MNKKVLMYIIAVVLIVIVAVLIGFAISKEGNNNQAIPTDSNTLEEKNDVVNNTSINNVVENNVINEVNNVISNEVTGEVENEISTEVENEEQDNNNSEEIDKDSLAKIEDEEERAIEIVKRDWGEDSKVYFYLDGKIKDGKCTVCVKSVETTNTLYEYKVDVNNMTFEKEWIYN